ncbi:MAG: hypothetical protein ACHQ50_04930, partial [Fimbriimonadales bacterium]
HLAQCMARNPDVVGQAFNFSTEIQVTVLDLVSRILRLMRSDLTAEVHPAAAALRAVEATGAAVGPLAARAADMALPRITSEVKAAAVERPVEERLAAETLAEGILAEAAASVAMAIWVAATAVATAAAATAAAPATVEAVRATAAVATAVGETRAAIPAAVTAAATAAAVAAGAAGAAGR